MAGRLALGDIEGVAERCDQFRQFQLCGGQDFGFHGAGRIGSEEKFDDLGKQITPTAAYLCINFSY
jgi:hypothetical protein